MKINHSALRTHYLSFILVFAISFLFWRCANIGNPQGGPKDETPPVIVKSTPEPNALNYQKQEVYIEFDELIQLKEMFQKFVVSPPVNEQPIIEARGNRLFIKFNEELQSNTTYTLDFADAVADNNEGNIIPNFSFSFSTGEVIDSLKVSGHVWDADDLSPSEGKIVLLHENLNDSAIHTLVPVRLAKTNSKGYFSILNVRPGQYRLYALDPAPNNYKFDQPGKRMAWSDIVVKPSHEYREVIDSIKVDPITGDSLLTDSIVRREELVYLPDSLELFMFQHDYKTQYLLSEERKEKAKLTYYFNRPLLQDAELHLTGEEKMRDLFLMERSFKNDTVSFWLKDSTYYNQDSLSVTLRYPTKDSLNNDIFRQDTIPMYFFETKKKETKKRKKDKDKKKKVPSIQLKNLKRSIDLFSLFSFELPSPAVQFDIEAVRLSVMRDTIPEVIPFEIIQDSMAIRHYAIDHEWEPGLSYQLEIDSAAILDIYGLVNHPIKAAFSVKPINSYGTVFMKIIDPQSNWLVQVLNRNDVIVQQASVPENGKRGFRYLNPGDYTFRILVDTNQNGQWDTGNYYENIQPEQIYYYPAKITIRANWEHALDTDWDIKKFNVDQFSRQYRKPKKDDK